MHLRRHVTYLVPKVRYLRYYNVFDSSHWVYILSDAGPLAELQTFTISLIYNSPPEPFCFLELDSIAHPSHPYLHDLPLLSMYKL